MKAVYLAAAAFVAGVAAQGKSQSKVNPPNHATPGPGTLQRHNAAMDETNFALLPLPYRLLHLPGCRLHLDTQW